ARELAAREREPHEVELFDDAVCEPRVRACVQRKRGQIMAIVVHDLADAIAHVALHSLALAEHATRDGIERIVLHAHESTAQQIDAIEHNAARHRRLPAAEITFRLAKTNGAGIAPDLERMPRSRRDALEHREVEVDGVPARDDVGIELAYALAEC